MDLSNLDGANAQAQPPQITHEMLKTAPTVQCECGGMIFSEKLFFKKISAIISPTGKEELAPMPILVCDKCGKVPRIFDTHNVLPDEIKAKKDYPKVDENKVNTIK